MNKLFPLLIFLGAAVLAACDRDTPDEPPVSADAPETAASDPISNSSDSPVLAVVNGTAIHQALLEAYFTARHTPDPTAQQKQFALDDLINLTLLRQAAEESGLTADAQFQALLRLERLRSVASAMAREHTSQNAVTEAQAQARYDSGVAQAGTQEYELNHILVTTQESAREMIAQLNEDAEFAALAEEHSIDAGDGAGGSLGWVNLAELPPPLATAVKDAPIGQVAPEPVQTPFGWHVMLVEATRPYTPPSFEEVKAGLIGSMQRQSIQQYVSGLRASAEIAIKTDFGMAGGDAPQRPES